MQTSVRYICGACGTAFLMTEDEIDDKLLLCPKCGAAAEPADERRREETRGNDSGALPGSTDDGSGGRNTHPPDLPRLQTFAEEFADGPPRRNSDQTGRHLGLTEQRYLLWRHLSGDRPARIAEQLGVHRSTVSRHLNPYVGAPMPVMALLLVLVHIQQPPPSEIPLTLSVLRHASKVAWFCRSCGSYYWDHDSADKHVDSEFEWMSIVESGT